MIPGIAPRRPPNRLALASPERMFLAAPSGLFAVPFPALCRDMPHRLFPYGKRELLCIRCRVVVVAR